MTIVHSELLDQQDTVLSHLEFYFVKGPSTDASCEAKI